MCQAYTLNSTNTILLSSWYYDPCSLDEEPETQSD